MCSLTDPSGIKAVHKFVSMPSSLKGIIMGHMAAMRTERAEAKNPMESAGNS